MFTQSSFFQSFLFVISITAIDGSIILPQRDNHNWPNAEDIIEMSKFSDILDNVPKPSDLANSSNEDGENNRAKRQAVFVIEENTLQVAKSGVQPQDQDVKKAKTLQKLLEHKEMYGKCAAIWNETEEFFKKGIQAKKDGFFSLLWFRAKHSLFSNKIAELQQSMDEAKRICHLSMESLIEAAKSGEYSEMVKMANEKVKQDFGRITEAMHGFIKEMKS